MNRRVRAVVGAGAMTLLVALAPLPALAHGRIVDSRPAEGSQVEEAPPELRIWISEPVNQSFSRVELSTLDGRPVPIDGLEVTSDEGKGLLVVDLRPLEDGTYSAEWTVLSESDGHITRGLVVFGVGSGALGVGSYDIPAEDLPITEAIVKWLSLAALMWVVGAVAVARILVRFDEHRWTRLLRRWISAGAAFGLIAGVAVLVTEAVAVSDGLPAGTSIVDVGWRLISTTTWGRLFAVREALFLVMVLVSVVPSPTTAISRWGGLATAVGLVVAEALSSHASGIAGQVALAVTVDAVHLAAASMWVGGLAAALVMHRRTGTVPWTRFGRAAAISVGVLLATGLFSTGLEVTSIDAAVRTSYGRVLIAKLVLFGAVGLLGLASAIVVHPRLNRAARRLVRRPIAATGSPRTRRIAWEAAVGVAVIAATGLLTSLSPANGTEYASREPVNAMSQMIDEMVVTLTAQPNRPGDNVLTVHTASSIKPAPAPIDRVLIRFARPADGLSRVTEAMEEVEPGRFRLGGSQLARAGSWDIEVVVRRQGLEDVVADFAWTVPVGTAVEGGLPSAPLAPATGTAAVFVLLLVTTALVWRLVAPERRVVPRIDGTEGAGVTKARHGAPAADIGEREMEEIGS